jgi:hypothetical protein
MTNLRTILRLDALASGGLGALLLALGTVLEEPLGLPVTLSFVVGAGLLAWAALVAWVSVGASPTWTAEVVAGNVVWVVASIVFAASGWVALTGLGVAFVLLQAAAVAGISVLQVAGLRAARTVVMA